MVTDVSLLLVYEGVFGAELTESVMLVVVFRAPQVAVALALL